MVSVKIYYNPLDGSNSEVFLINPGTRLIDFLQKQFPDGFGGMLRVFVGNDELQLDDLDYAVEESQHITMLVMPAGALTAAEIGRYLVQAAVAIAVGYLINLIFPPSTPKSLKEDDQNPVYSIGATPNVARLGEPIGVHYGTVNFPPDFASQPYIFYSDTSNDMFVDELLVLGHGKYRIEKILVGDTPAVQRNTSGDLVPVMEPNAVQWLIMDETEHMEMLGNISEKFWEMAVESPYPHEFYENVFTSPEVENWEFNDAIEPETPEPPASISGRAFAGVFEPEFNPPLTRPGVLREVPDSIIVKRGDRMTLASTTDNDGTFTVGSVVSDPEYPGTIRIFEEEGANFIKTEDPLNAAATYQINESASGMVAGPFRAQKLGQTISQVHCDIVFPQGLYEISDSNNIRNHSVTLRFHYQGINETTGLPSGEYKSIQRTFTRNQRTPYRVTVRSGDLTSGAYEVSVERVSPIANDSRKIDTVTWTALKGIIDLDQTQHVYGPVTMLAVRLKATNGFGPTARSRVRVIATRLLDTGSSNNPITIIKDIFVNPDYGMQRSLDEMNTARLDQLEAIYENSWGPKFNGSFTQRSTGYEGMNSVVSLAGARLTHDGSLVDVSPDMKQSVRHALFSSANIVRGSMKIEYSFDTTGDTDGIRVEYRDPDTFEPRFHTYPASAINPEQHNLFGCTDLTYARRMARYLYNVKTTRRKLAKLQTELEGLIPRFGYRVAVAHPLPSWGDAGVIIEVISQTEFRADQALNWTSNNVVVLRDEHGKPSSVISAVRGATPDIVKLSGAPSFTIVSPGTQEPTHYTFGEADTLIRDFLVTRIQPSSDNLVAIEAQTYDESIFDGAPIHMVQEMPI